MRPLTRIALVSLASAALALGGWAALAQNDVVLTGASTSLADEQQALRDARTRAADARRRSEQLEARAQAAGAAADKARAEAAALASRIQESEADIRAGEARMAILARLQQAQARKLAAKQEPAVRLMAALQILSRRPPALMLLRPGSMQDAIHARAMLATAAPVIEQRTASLRADIAGARRLQQAAQSANDALRSSRTQLAEREQRLQALEASQRQASSSLSADALREDDRALAMGEKARDIVELMGRLDAAQVVEGRLRSLDAPAPRPNDTPSALSPAIDTPYRLPVSGALITGLGEINPAGVRSRGLALAASPGAQVAAPAGGTVAFAGPYRSFGRIAIIDHGDGWTSLIAGIGALSVRQGQSVQQGDVLGTAPPARATVTVELRRNGRPIDIVALISGG